MKERLTRSEFLWFPLVLAALLAIYLPGLGNAPVFDDTFLLEEGDVFAKYGSLLELRTRMLSYGSFVWVRDLFGDGWWKQRLVNLAIHAGVVLALWALYREILRAIVAPAAPGGSVAAPSQPYYRSPALGLAIGFFALNPAATYAVAYLIQRSILLVTLFVALGLWLFARGLRQGKPLLHALSALCYVLAVMSKEHALLAPLAAIPLYIVIARPGRRQLLILAAASATLILAAALVLSLKFGEIIGRPFDEFSRIYIAQLAKLGPEAERNAYPFSIINQSYFFFRYGLHWLIPFSGWMSIDLRPPFPISWFSLPQVLGPAGFVAVVAAGFVLVVRYRDWRALAGLSLLFPALLFATEFATVWVQDPFVLYRSYLWAIGVPGLVFILVHGPAPRVVAAVGLVLASLFTWQSLDRVLSMATSERVWTDAIVKLPDDPRSVGRWFPYLNRGNIRYDNDQFSLALQDFDASSKLGDQGMGAFNVGTIHARRGNHAHALQDYARAEHEGYALYNLPFQRGLSLQALGRYAEAFGQFEAARRLNPPSPAREGILLNLGRAALRLGKGAEAVAALDALAGYDPKNREARFALALACTMSGDPARSRKLLDALIAEEAIGPVYFARAQANHALKRKLEAAADIDEAIRLGPDNPAMQEWRERIRAMPAQP